MNGWDVSYPHAFLTGGRGYGKNAARERLLAAAKAEERRRDTLAPGIGMVRWDCAKPTEPLPPVYVPGTVGWYHEQAQMVYAGEKTFTQVMAEAEAAR